MTARARAYQRLLAILLGFSILGVAISLWAHFDSLAGLDPGQQIRGFWGFQLLLCALLLPVAIELFSTKNPGRLLRSPNWMRWTLYGFLVYYGLNFYYFLYWSVDHLDSSATWRMISSGWLLLFGLAAVYYWVRLWESKS